MADNNLYIKWKDDKDKVTVNQQASLTDAQKYTSADSNQIRDKHNLLVDRTFDVTTGNTNEVPSYSAIHDVDYTFNVTADNFPAGGDYHKAEADQLTLDAADSVLWRIDLIVAIAPIAPEPIGTVGIIKGSDFSSENLIISPDYDPATTFVIKEQIVKPNTTEPDTTSQTLIYDEDTGHSAEANATSNSANIVTDSTNDPTSGTVSIESTNQIKGDKVTFVLPSAINTSDLDNLAFSYKGKAKLESSVIRLRWFLGGVQIGNAYDFGHGQNGLDGTNTGKHQDISIDGSKFNLPDGTVDTLEWYVYKSYAGFFLDEITINTGSGVILPDEGLQDLQSVTDKGNTTNNSILLSKETDTNIRVINTVSDNTSFMSPTVVSVSELSNNEYTFISKGGIQIGDVGNNEFLSAFPSKIDFLNNSWALSLEAAALTNTRIQTLQDKDGVIALLSDITGGADPEVWNISFSGTNEVLSVGIDKEELQMPNYATTLIGVAVSLTDAPTVSTLVVDVNINGSTALGDKISVDAGEKTSETAVTPPTITTSAIPANAVITIDVDTLDSGGTSAGGKLIMYWEKA